MVKTFSAENIKIIRKEVISIFFALFFYIFRLFPVNKRKITFVMTHDTKFNGNLKYIYEELAKEYPDYKKIVISKADYLLIKKRNIFRHFFSLFIIKNYHLATSGYVLLNNIFLTGAYLKFKKKVKVIQVWHATGCFKKFGQHYIPTKRIGELQTKANRIYTNVVVNSKHDVHIYAEAFNVSEKIVIPLGNASCDFLLNPINMTKAREKLYEQYPVLKYKKVIMYAPTLRENQKKNNIVLNVINTLGKFLDKDHIVLFRLHPYVHNHYQYKKIIFSSDNVIDVSFYEDVNELFAVTDLLITDYSSIIYEYTLLEKPIIFFAFDLDEYKQIRDFYYNYEEFVPGSISYDVNDLIRMINSWDFINNSKLFKYRWHDFLDGKSAERFVKYFFN